MSETKDELRAVVLQALSGRGAHALVRGGFDGLTWEQAGAAVATGNHTIFQLLNHLVYWQDFALAWIDGDKPPTPEHAAESWPGESVPSGTEEWQQAVERFFLGLEALESRAEGLELLAPRGPKSVLEILQLIASHNSYHLGQVAWVRRTLGAWPPPGGGATW